MIVLFVKRFGQICQRSIVADEMSGCAGLEISSEKVVLMNNQNNPHNHNNNHPLIFLDAMLAALLLPGQFRSATHHCDVQRSSAKTLPRPAAHHWLEIAVIKEEAPCVMKDGV